MATTVEFAEYLAEIREQVCDGCSGRAFEERCRRCSITLYLPQLVNWIRTADAEPGWQEVFASCTGRDEPGVPAAADSLFGRLVRAVKRSDERREQRDLVRRWAARQWRPAKVPIAQIIQAYEATTGTYLGCD